MRVCSELRRDNKTVGVQIERWNEYVRKSRRSVGVSIACASCLSMHVASCKSIEDDDKKDRKKEVDEAEKADVFIQGIKDQVQQALSKALHSDAFLHFQSKVNECITFDTDRQLSYGFIMGFCSGIALKKMSKAGAVALGAVFILLQSIAYAGYIHVNYEKLEHDLMSVLDLNKVRPSLT